MDVEFSTSHTSLSYDRQYHDQGVVALPTCDQTPIARLLIVLTHHRSTNPSRSSCQTARDSVGSARAREHQLRSPVSGEKARLELLMAQSMPCSQGDPPCAERKHYYLRRNHGQVAGYDSYLPLHPLAGARKKDQRQNLHAEGRGQQTSCASQPAWSRIQCVAPSDLRRVYVPYSPSLSDSFDWSGHSFRPSVCHESGLCHHRWRLSKGTRESVPCIVYDAEDVSISRATFCCLLPRRLLGHQDRKLDPLADQHVRCLSLHRIGLRRWREPCSVTQLAAPSRSSVHSRGRLSRH